MNAHTPVLETEKPKRLFITYPTPWSGVAVRDRDWSRIKEIGRLVLPEVRPGRRLEFIARELGFRTSAAMQAAVLAATETDLFLAPDRAPQDEFRRGILIEQIEKGIDQDKLDALCEVGATLCCGLLIGNKSGEDPKSLQEIVAFMEGRHANASAPGYNFMRNGKPGPVDLDRFLPDLRTCFFGDERFMQDAYPIHWRLEHEGDPWIEIVDVSRGSPSADDIKRIGSSGDIRRDVFGGACCYLDEPEYKPHELAVTLLSRAADGSPQAFMTLRFTISTSEPDLSRVIEDLFLDANADPDDNEITYWKMTNWLLQVTFEGFGVRDDQDELEALGEFIWAVRAVTRVIMYEVNDCANDTDLPVRTEVLPVEGDHFGFITADIAANWIGELVEEAENEPELYGEVEGSHTFEYIEP